MQGRLVIVSSRVPSRTNPTGEGALSPLSDALEREGDFDGPSHAVWFGWSGRIKEDRSASLSVKQTPKVTYVGVDLTAGQYRGYVNSSTKNLWPVLHEVGRRVTSRDDDPNAYRAVSRVFAQHLTPMLLEEDRIWVHDHHLIPVGRMLRAAGIAQPIGFFLNAPFPPAEKLAAVGWGDELAADLAAYDLVGFQSQRDAVNFKEFMREARQNADGGFAAAGERPRTGVFPVGIQTRSFIEAAAAAEIEDRVSRLERSFRGKQLIITADRLDPTRGLVGRLAAFETLLDAEPDLRTKACMVQITTRPKERLPGLIELRRNQQSLTQRINARFLTLGWIPVYDIYGAPNREVLISLYRLARAGLATPLRDGMSLTAKEYVAAQNPRDPGVLILSRFAGAADMLFEALIVDPDDVVQISRALAEALRMPLDERQDRWRRMMVKLLRHDADEWYRSFARALERARGHILPEPAAWPQGPAIPADLGEPPVPAPAFEPIALTLSHIPLPVDAARLGTRG
jgi:trehalose 6-phosphate synthase